LYFLEQLVEKVIEHLTMQWRKFWFWTTVSYWERQ